MHSKPFKKQVKNVIIFISEILLRPLFLQSTRYGILSRCVNCSHIRHLYVLCE